MRKILLLATVVGGLTALGTLGASAAPAVSSAMRMDVAPQHVVQADYYWHHRRWHHRHWSHGHWRYWD